MATWPQLPVVPTLVGQPRLGTGQVIPRITLLDLKLRESIVGGETRPRFRLHVARKSDVWLGYIERRGGTPEALDRLLTSAGCPGVRPAWASPVVWKETLPSNGQEWRAWVDMYMDAVPSDWGWRHSVRLSNLSCASDHAHGGWTGAFGQELLRTGFQICRGLLSAWQVQLLLETNRLVHLDDTCGDGLHHVNGIRGIAVYVWPDLPENDPWPRREQAQLIIGKDHKDLAGWHSIMETLRLKAGRKSWPHDIDCMASWPQNPLGEVQRRPQQLHQDGCFSMLAVTVFLTQSQGTIFGDYRGKELMAMGNQSRLEYLGATFRSEDL